MSSASFEVFLSDIDLLDLIAFYCQRSKTSVLHISSAQHAAAIYFAQGKIVHAIFDGQLGKSALLQILKISNGKISSEDGVLISKNTLDLGIDDFIAFISTESNTESLKESPNVKSNSNKFEIPSGLEAKEKLKLYLQYGYQAYLSADYQQAKDLWEEALKLDPFNARLKQNLAQIANLY